MPYTQTESEQTVSFLLVQVEHDVDRRALRRRDLASVSRRVHWRGSGYVVMLRHLNLA